MFTGIIQNIGLFKGYRQGKQEIAVQAPSLASQIETGESLAVNGVCLSLVRKEKDTLFFNLSPETIKVTTLGSLRLNERLNLEQPLSLSTPLSGHLLSGHVDYRAKVIRISERKNGRRVKISFPIDQRNYFIPKGSVAVNGVSLTIAELGNSWFEVELIPITLKKSNLVDLKTGDAVNVECDMIGKYVYNWISKWKR
jgi:riboflavin synthase